MSGTLERRAEMNSHNCYNKLTLLASNHPVDAVPAFNEAAACVEDLAIDEDITPATRGVLNALHRLLQALRDESVSAPRLQRGPVGWEG
jgi:hypothetical protein